MSNTKVYQEVVKQLREMISQDGLKAGDKIPSERELSERLNFGRSSVREALRALELLGLIETRRGEGTFIRDFRGNQLVQLLSTFILQDEKAKRDVLETKFFIEINCLQLALQRLNQSIIERLQDYLINNTVIDDDEFFFRIVDMADNHLFFRMWIILKDYYNSLGKDQIDFKKENYHSLLNALIKQDETEMISSYRNLRNLTSGIDKI